MTPQPFTVQVPDAVLDDLAHRLSHVRWPVREFFRPLRG